MNSEGAPRRSVSETGVTAKLQKRQINRSASSESAETREGRRGKKGRAGWKKIGERSLSPDLHFDKKSRGKFSPISVLSYLILYHSAPLLPRPPSVDLLLVRVR